MKEILIVTDSCADIPSYIDLKHTKVIPFSFYFKGDSETIYEDVKKYSNNDYYRRLNIGVESIPVIPSVEVIEKVLRKAKDSNMDVIVVHSHDSINYGLHNNFKQAKENVQMEKIDMNILVIDSHQFSLSLGLLIYKLDKLVSEGKTYDEIADYVLHNRDKYCLEFIPESDEYLLKRKIIVKRKVVISELLKLNNIYSLNSMGIYVKKRINNNESSFDYMSDDVVKNSSSNEDVGIIYNFDEDRMNNMKDHMRDKKVLSRVLVSESSKVSGAIMGPRAIGVAYKKI